MKLPKEIHVALEDMKRELLSRGDVLVVPGESIDCWDTEIAHFCVVARVEGDPPARLHLIPGTSSPQPLATSVVLEPGELEDEHQDLRTFFSANYSFDLRVTEVFGGWHSVKRRFSPDRLEELEAAIENSTNYGLKRLAP